MAGEQDVLAVYIASPSLGQVDIARKLNGLALSIDAPVIHGDFADSEVQQIYDVVTAI